MRKEAKFGVVGGLILAVVVVAWVFGNHMFRTADDNSAGNQVAQTDNTPSNVVDFLPLPTTTPASEPSVTSMPGATSLPTGDLTMATSGPSATTGPATSEPSSSRLTFGNSAPGTPQDTVSASTGGTGESYTIKSGDNLWTIAKTKLGDANKQDLIRKANPGLDPEHLRVGQKIVIPGAGSSSTMTETSNDSLGDQVTSSTAGSGAGETYVVKSGDTLWSIAKAKLGDASKQDLLVKANPGLTPSKLKIGQKLSIPAVTGSLSSSDTGSTSRPAAHAERPAKKAKPTEPSNRPIFD